MSAAARQRWPAVSAPVLVGVLALLVAALTLTSSRDVLVDSLDWSVNSAAGLAWPALSVVVVCSIAHYLAAAAATCAAIAQPLPRREVVLAQLSAAAANKLTPAGLGGSAVLARYLHQRAGMSAASATGAVSVIALGRAVAAVLTLVVLAVAGPWVGINGGSAELATLARTLHGTVVAHSWLLVALLGAVGVVAVVAIRARATMARFVAPLRDILRRPAAAGTVLAASATQTIVLGVAFAAAVYVLPGGLPHASIGALIVGYIAATALAAAVPMPGGLGSSETALAAVLVGSQVALGHAIADVMVFRVVTLWLPAVAGVPSVQILRRRRGL